MTLSCVLCESVNVGIRETIDVRELRRLYEPYLGAATTASVFASAPRRLDYIVCNDCCLGFFQPLFVGSSILYAALQRHDWYYQSTKHEFRYAASRVNAGDAVLEIGCGRGAFVEFLPMSITYVGLELTRVSAEKARARGLDVHETTIENHSRAKAASYDVVAAFQVLEHVPSPRQVISAAASCLRPGGRLILSVPNNDSYLGSLSNAPLNMPPHHQTRWSRSTFNKAAELFGLTLIECEREPLSNEHVDAYSTALVQRAIDCFFARPRGQLIETSAYARATLRAARMFGRLLGPVFADHSLRPVGDAMTVIFRKQA